MPLVPPFVGSRGSSFLLAAAATGILSSIAGAIPDGREVSTHWAHVLMKSSGSVPAPLEESPMRAPHRDLRCSNRDAGAILRKGRRALPPLLPILAEILTVPSAARRFAGAAACLGLEPAVGGMLVGFEGSMIGGR